MTEVNPNEMILVNPNPMMFISTQLKGEMEVQVDNNVSRSIIPLQEDYKDDNYTIRVVAGRNRYKSFVVFYPTPTNKQNNGGLTSN